MLFRGHDAVAAVLASLVAIVIIKLVELFFPGLPPSLAPYALLTFGPLLRAFFMATVESRSVPKHAKPMIWIALAASVFGPVVGTLGMKFIFLPGHILKGWIIYCAGVSFSLYFSLPLIRAQRNSANDKIE